MVDTPSEGQERRRADDVTIREYVDQRHAEMERRVEELHREIAQRFEQQQRFDELSKTTLDESVAAATQEARRSQEMIERQMDSHTRAHEREHAMTEEAIAKSEGMLDRRLESVVEATQARQEQAGEIITRQEHEQVRQQVESLSTTTVTRREFEDTRRLVYMGLGMAVIFPILITITFFLSNNVP